MFLFCLVFLIIKFDCEHWSTVNSFKIFQLFCITLLLFSNGFKKNSESCLSCLVNLLSINSLLFKYNYLEIIESLFKWILAL